MTSTRARLPALPPPPPAPIVPRRRSRCDQVTRPHRLYFVIAFDPRTVTPTLVLSYIGITSRRDPARRFEEHVEDQPWSDLIPVHDPVLVVAARLFIVASDVYCCEAHAREAEQDAIVTNRPLYNYEFNLGNAERITIPQARAARAVRDHARGLPYEKTWAAQFEARQAARRAAALAGLPWYQRLATWWRTRPRRRWTRRERKIVVRSVVWLAATIALWIALARWVPVASTWRLGGIAGAVAGLGVLWRTDPPRRRKMRRAVHRAAAIGLLGVIVLLLVAGRGPFG